MTKKRILIWLSGGVDSAVSAYLLKQQGYEVVAGFMKNYADESNPNCHTREDRNMAIKVAQHLGIQDFLIFDFRQEYEERIINYIYEGYKQGITPNPDVFCNNLIKFDLFLEKAMTYGFDYIATGHYAQIEKKNKEYKLLRGLDRNKDQSYFLSRLNQQQLAHSLLPLWWMTKPEVRAIADKIELPNADRKDSQGLCFIGNVPMREFLKQKLPIKPWNIILTNGTKVGIHDGAWFRTIGQSRGLDLNKKAYVVATDIHKNTVTISFDRDDTELLRDSITARSVHRISYKPTLPFSCTAKIRYRQDPPVAVNVRAWEENTITVHFGEHQRGIAPGQSIVFYDEETCLGSGIIG